MPILAALVLLATLGFVASPLLTDPFTGFRADQLRIPQPNPPIQPAGYAFAIWGVIYLWLLASAGFGFWKRPQSPAWNAMRLPLLGSLTVGVFWLWIANTSALWATVTIWLMLAGAVGALLRSPADDRWLARAPVALYAGWLTAASFVSLAVLLAGMGIALNAYGWAIAGIPLATGLGVSVQRRVPHAPEYGLAVAWAFIGVAVANGTGLIVVTLLAALGAIAMGIMALRSQLRMDA